MKKLTTLILASFLFAAVFAAPKVPKCTWKSYFHDETDPYVYLSKDSNIEYSIIALTDIGLKIDYLIRFDCTFLNQQYTKYIEIGFDTEQQLDSFIKNFNLSKIEKEFDRIVNILIKENAQIVEKTNSIKYSINGSNIKF